MDAVNKVSARPVVGECEYSVRGVVSGAFAGLALGPAVSVCGCEAESDPDVGAGSENKAVVGDGCAGFKFGLLKACTWAGAGPGPDGAVELVEAALPPAAVLGVLEALESALDLVPLLELA